MNKTYDIRVYCSACVRMEDYLDRAAATARQLGLDFTIDRVTDKAMLDEKKVILACGGDRCPGCKRFHAPMSAIASKGYHIAPALVINGEVVFSTFPPDDERLYEIMSEYVKQTQGDEN